MKRARRIQKLVEIKQRELDSAMAYLARAQTEAMALAEKAKEAKNFAIKAEKEHFERLSAGMTASAWSEGQAWVFRSQKVTKLAEKKQREGEAVVEEARRLVVVAQANVERVKALVERLEKQQKAVEALKERKLDDEFARRAASARNPKSGENSGEFR